MRKYSRRHGWIILKTYASGNGCIDFTWILENNKNGTVVPEFVTESDVSTYLRQLSEAGEHKWDGWDIFMFGYGKRPHPVLVQAAVRPFGTSNKLIFQNEKFEYFWKDKYRKEQKQTNNIFNLVVFAKDLKENVIVENISIRLGIFFFLTHEKDFENQGFIIRGTRND